MAVSSQPHHQSPLSEHHTASSAGKTSHTGWATATTAREGTAHKWLWCALSFLTDPTSAHVSQHFHITAVIVLWLTETPPAWSQGPSLHKVPPLDPWWSCSCSVRNAAPADCHGTANSNAFISLLTRVAICLLNGSVHTLLHHVFGPRGVLLSRL